MLRALITFTILSLAFSAIKIPAAPYGLSIGSLTPKLHIEGFFNLISPIGSKSYTAFWAALQKLNIDHNPDLRFTFYVSPDPSFSFSFLTSTGASYIAKNSNNTHDLWLYYETVFANYQTFSNPTTANQSVNDVATTLAKLVNQKLPQFSVDELYQGFFTLSYLLEAEQYGSFSISRSVVHTPTYFANGVQADNADQFSTDGWVRWINNFVEMSKGADKISL